MTIRYIRQKDINYLLWDRCISNSLNGLVYAYSWYLDIVADHWDALVEDDYRTVMPLIYKYKSFFKKIYSPLLSKQLGVFSVKPLTETRINQFISSVPKSFRQMKICFNRQNCQSMKNHNNYSILKTFELDLIIPYEKKYRLYSDAAKVSLSIANAKKLHILKGLSVAEMEIFIRQYDTTQNENVVLKPLKLIMSQLISAGKGEIIGVYDHTNMLVSLACFIKTNQNVILLYALTNAFGMEAKANYLIIDSFLKNYSSRNITLSLDHLDETWNMQLYTDFGALESNYYRMNENRLPFFLKWL